MAFGDPGPSYAVIDEYNTLAVKAVSSEADHRQAPELGAPTSQFSDVCKCHIWCFSGWED